MKNRIIISIFYFSILFIWSCDGRKKMINEIDELLIKTKSSYDYNLVKLMIEFNAKYPEDTTYCHEMGRYYVNIKDYKSAYECYTRIVSVDPKNKTAYINRAYILSLNEDYDRAIDDINTAMKLTPTDTSINAVKSYYEQLRKQTVIFKQYDSLLVVQPMQANVYFKRGESYFRNMKFSNALYDLDKAISIDSSNCQYFLFRARIYIKLDSLADGISDYIKASELCPSDVAIKTEKDNYILFAKYEKDIKRLSAYLDNTPELQGYITRSQLYVRVKQYDKALNDMNAAIRIKADAAALYQARALIFSRLKKYSEAQLDINKFIELGGGEPNKALVAEIDKGLKDLINK